MSALTAQRRTAAITEWDEGYKKLVVSTVLKPKNREATGPEIAMFAEQVQRTKLDPFMRQIYGIYRKDDGVEKLTIQVGIDGFRLIADRTGKYEGQTPVEWCDAEGNWTDVWLKDGSPAAARVGVRKSGHPEPTVCVAHWAEYLPPGNPGPMWKKMPANQLAKCAEALALRKSFPNELSGLYAPEEMAQAESISPEHDATATAVEETGEVDRQMLIDAFDLAVAEGVDEGRIKTIFVAHGAQDTNDIGAAIEAVPPNAIEALTRDLNQAASNAIDKRAAEAENHGGDKA